jgi:hypothetical protein
MAAVLAGTNVQEVVVRKQAADYCGATLNERRGFGRQAKALCMFDPTSGALRLHLPELKVLQLRKGGVQQPPSAKNISAPVDMQPVLRAPS